MAYLPDDDKLLDPNDPNKQQQGLQEGGGIVSGSGPSSGVLSPSANPNPGAVGPGGQGAWTNIQSYLSANKGDTGSADKFNKETDNIYGQEKSKLQESSTQTKTQAQSAANSLLGKDQASRLIEDASKNYSWGTQTEPYTQSVGQIKNTLNAQYSGPQSFAYGLGANTQKYGQDLGNDQAFRSIIKNLYNNEQGRNMTQGQHALQEQLDVNSTALADARQRAIQRYAGLQGEVDTTVTDTNKSIEDARTLFGNKQKDVRDYLMGEQDTTRGALTAAEEAARKAYEGELDQTQFYDKYKLIDDVHQFDDLANYSVRGMNDAVNRARMTGPGQVNLWHGMNTDSGDTRDVFGERTNEYAGLLNNWYQGADARYANTGDAEKRRWNALADALGLGDRLSQGFGPVRRL